MKREEMTLNHEHAFRYVRKFIMWVLNRNSSNSWIHEIWDKVGLGDHLELKFDGYCKTFGSEGGAIHFFANLDEENQERFINWIFDNYTGTKL